jgi:hypothetical protein
MWPAVALLIDQRVRPPLSLPLPARPTVDREPDVIGSSEICLFHEACSSLKLISSLSVLSRKFQSSAYLIVAFCDIFFGPPSCSGGG